MDRRMLAIALLVATVVPISAQDAGLAGGAREAMRRAADFYRGKVARHGGYVYYTSVDLKDRWGEGRAAPDQVWVQPPGTPTVGLAYLGAHAATGDASFLEAATETAMALAAGQLSSGGWTASIDFAGGKAAGKYRRGGGGEWNVSSLDDGQTQSALLMLMRCDEATGFRDAVIHEAALAGLAALLEAQFPNGAFPQVWRGPVAAKPVTKAAFPDHDWRTERRVKAYWDLYTLNDGLAGTVCDVLIEARRIYRDERYATALQRLGDFLVLAQMPDPQPGWCQQYHDDMTPAWARKFEPPAVSGWESQDAIRTLIRIHRATGRKEHLEPIPRALDWLGRSLLPDGRVARFYELRTNRPLYMTADYELSYDVAAAPKHYGWTQASHLAELRRAYDDALQGKPDAARPAPSEAEVRGVIDALDAEGRWVSVFAGEPLVGQPKFPGSFRYLSSEVFSRNLALLSAYVEARKR